MGALDFAGGVVVHLTSGISALAAVIGVVAVYSFVITVVLLKIIDWTIGIRVSDEEEVMGLDLSQHEESGYTL